MSEESALGPGEWPELERLFDALLESEAPEQFIAGLTDGAMRRELIRLWREHGIASDSAFLATPVASVHALMEPEYCFVPGQLLANRFRIEKLLGAGGMGEVYLAFDQRLSQPVALKTMARDLAERPDICGRFVAEVQSARRVTHPNVCRIFDLFEDGATPFFVMEYLRGPSLAEWLEGAARPASARRKIALDLAEGIAAAHANGIVHRDLKPGNIIITNPDTNPRAVVTDFGLARAFEESDSSGTLSLQAGTINYMAPELRKGASATRASDIYAFGVILRQLLPKNRLAAVCTAEQPPDRPQSLDPAIARWRNRSTRRWLITGAIVSPLALLAGFKAISNPRVVFASRQRIAFTSFEPRTDSVAGTLRDLLITAIRQSPLVNVIGDEHLAALLNLKPSAPPPQPAQIRALASAAQIGFILEGSLSHSGNGIRLLIRVLDALTGEPAVTVAESGQARNFVQVANQAAVRLRRGFGESADSLQSTYKDLEQATSAIPEAVQAFFEGVRLYEGGDAPRSLVWFDRAIEFDPRFALAHLYRGINLAASDEGAQAYPSYERAYQLRSRVAERERLWIESRYANISEDRLGAVAILRRLVQLYPDEAVFQRHMGFALARMERPAEALEHDRKAIELDPGSVNNRNVLICDLAQAGRYDEAIETFRQCRAEGIESPLLETGAGIAWEGKGDFKQARASYDRMTDSTERYHQAQLPRAGLLLLEGRFQEAAALLESDLAFDEAVGRSRARETRRAWLGLTEWLMDRPQKARLRAAAIAQLPVTMPVYLTNFHAGAVLADLTGSTDLTLTIAARIGAIQSTWPSTHSRGAYAHAQALARQAIHDPAAEAGFEEAHGLWPGPLVVFSVARWQRQTGNFSAALTTLDELDSLEGDILRNHFTGFVVLGWLERAFCLKSLSRNIESSRLFKRVLDRWGENAGSFSIVSSARREYLELNRQ